MIEGLDFRKAKRVVITTTTNQIVMINISKMVDIFPSKEGLTVFHYKPKDEKQVEIEKVQYFPMVSIEHIVIDF